ncbi:MAG TPA: hypothetical protein VIC26_03410 [Marinagarivorans sp.]
MTVADIVGVRVCWRFIEVPFVMVMIRAEFNKAFWNSPLQLACLALVLYGLSFFAAPALACGLGNTDHYHKAFRCASGQMLFTHKLFIVTGLALASLCAGRAVSLFSEKGNHPRSQPPH